jgi:cytochrome P450
MPSAGHETAAHTLTWVFGYLALFPDVQENVYREIIQVCHDEQPSAFHLSYLLPSLLPTTSHF